MKYIKADLTFAVAQSPASTLAPGGAEPRP